MDYFSPKFALTTQTTWTVFVISSIYMLGGFSSNFLAFGPIKENPVKFMGILIDSWFKVFFIILFKIFNGLNYDFF